MPRLVMGTVGRDYTAALYNLSEVGIVRDGITPDGKHPGLIRCLSLRDAMPTPYNTPSIVSAYTDWLTPAFVVIMFAYP